MKSILPLYTQESFRNLIGIDYEKRDCYEIVVDFYKQILGLDLDLLYDIRPKVEEIPDIIRSQKSRFEKVSTPQFGDIISFNIYGLASHIGVYIDKKSFFHSRATTGSIIDKFDIWEKRIIGYYRWPK